MNSLRPTAASDTTPLRPLENQSVSSESSTATQNNTTDSCGKTGTNETTTRTSVVKACYVQAAETASSAASQDTVSTEVATPPDMRVSTVEANCNKKTMNGGHKRREIVGRIALDGLILGCVSLPILAFHLNGQAYKRGFFCDDASLKHPYKHSTVPNWMLYVMCLAIPIAIITIVEFFIANHKRMSGFGNLNVERFYLCQLQIPDWIVEWYNKVGVLVFGAGIGQLTTDIAKYSIGRLRPHFFAVCQPIMPDGSTCDDSINIGRYIVEFTCRGETATKRMLKEMRLSFPSGHANFAFFTMVYMAIYLQRRMSWQRCTMFKHLLQFVFLMFAWYTALTRVADYQHHWTDVLAGSLIGAFYAITLAISMW